MSASATERGATVPVRGVEVFVRQLGPGDVPVLLLNGLGSNADMWGVVEDRLSAQGRTIVFDMPGSGRSPTPLVPLSIAGYAALTVALLDELGHARVDIVGYSLGGMVAQQVTRDAPDRVRRLSLVSTGCGLGGMPPTAEAVALLSMPLRYHNGLLYRATNRLLDEPDRELLAQLPSLTESRLRNPPELLGYVYQLAAGSMWSSLRWLSSLQVPTIVLAGAADQVVPVANAYQLARFLPESRLHVLPGGHLCVFDPEGPASDLLHDFFTSTELSGSRAWSTGVEIDDDAAVERALASSRGALPYRWVNDVYRRLVHAAGP